MFLRPCPHALPPQGRACPGPQRGRFTSCTHRCPVPAQPGPSSAPGIGPRPRSRDAARGLAQAPTQARPPRSVPAQPPARSRPGPAAAPGPDAPVPPRRPGPDPGPAALPAGKCSPALAARRRTGRDRTTSPSIPHAELQLPSCPAQSAGRTTTPSSLCECPCPCPRSPGGPGTGEFGTPRVGLGPRCAGRDRSERAPAVRNGGSGQLEITGGEDSGTPRLGFTGGSRGSESSPPASLFFPTARLPSCRECPRAPLKPRSPPLPRDVPALDTAVQVPPLPRPDTAKDPELLE